jgi:exodeoxyribonuclease VIII|tara:strand:+ start:422 stop:1399 length:978 start_codon:yes stop_codon:yes gene_type:complete
MLKENISNAEYHGSGELSRSTAWSLLTTCPQKVKYDMTHRKESSPALVIGSAFHAATLEPGKFDDEFAVKPSEIDGQGPRTKHYKEAFEIMQKNEPNKSWLAPSDYDLVMDMAASALDHPILRTNMAEQSSIIEGTGFFEMEGAKCKVRPDLYNPGAGVVIDLKSTQDASEKGFAKSVRQFGYTFQACWYMHALRLLGEKPKQFIFLAVEKSAPHLTAAYTLSATDIDKQMANMEKACKLWATCESSGVWPSYTDDVTTLDLGSLHGNNRLNVMQMADKFGVSRTYVYRIIRTHNLETKNIGNRRTIDITDFANAVRRDEEGKAA